MSGQQFHPQTGSSPYYGRPPVAPVRAATSRTGSLFLGVVAGLVVALIAGAVLYFTDIIRFTSEAPEANSAPITLPEDVNGLKPINAVVADLSGEEKSTPVTEFNSLTEKKLAESLSLTYGGSAAAVRLYSDGDLVYRPTVTAVRAPTPGLFLPQYTGPEALERLQVAEAPREIITTGDVQCEVFRVQTSSSGTAIDPANTGVAACQRTDATLTVRVYGGGSGESNSVEVNAALINSVWNSLTSTSTS